VVLHGIPYLQRMSGKISPIEVPNLKNKVAFPNVGHWVNQERAAECNKLIIDFLKQP
jgi:pimeloyl-ACP methyl ester carboxylesterase